MSLVVDEKQIPENADACYVLDKNIDIIYMFGKLIWKKQKYYFVTFNSNGGSGAMNQQTMPVGVSTALTANTFSRLGYLFSAWAKSASGSAAYTDKQSVKDIAAAGETITLYALWTAITWYVVYNANGGSGSMADSEHKYDTAKALTANAFARSGYNFSGWATSSGGAKVYDDKRSVKNLKSTHGAILNLYAVWKMTEILTAGTWKSSATSVNNGVMSYNSEGYLAATISVKDGTATFAGPSFNIDVTDLSTISFTVYLWGYDSTDASGHCNVTFTIGGKSINFHHNANDAAATQTLSIDVSSMSGVQKCTCTMVEDCRQEEDEWGWSSNHTVRLLNITPT